jgi:hypothetical protein
MDVNPDVVNAPTLVPNEDPQMGQIRSKVLRYLTRMLDFRRQYDQRRATFYRQYVGQRDAMKFPDNVTNRANTFVPYPLSNVETIVSRVQDAFFSFDPWFEVNGSTEADDHSAEAMSLVLLKKLQEANFLDAFETLVRNIVIYGHSGIKVDWNWDYKVVVKPLPQYLMDQRTNQPVPDPQTGQPIVIGYQIGPTKVPMACPRITAIDIYDLMCDPDNGILAQLTERTFIEMKRENEAYTEAKGTPLYYPDAMQRIEQRLKQTCPDDYESVIIRFAELWNVYEGTCTTITFGDDKEAMAWKDLRASFRASNVSSYKRKIYEGNEVLWHGDNPFDHQRNPILHTSFIKLPNELYGLGGVEIITDLSESLNKFVNMVTDNWNLGINRRFAYDVNADIDHEALNQMNVPGGKVPVNGNPSEVLFPLPLFTPNAGDYQIIELYKGMIEMTSGVSDFYAKGAGSPTNNKTATGISSVITESNYRFKMFIRNLEVDILQPLLAMCASMIQQFMTDQEEVLITKNPMGPAIPKWQVIDPQSIIGNFEFNLVAADYATSKAVRQRNLMAFMAQAAQSPYWNAGEGLRELGKVMEIRNIDELLKSDQQVQQEQQQALQSQQQEMLMQEVVKTESAIEIAKATIDEQARVGLGRGGGGSGGGGASGSKKHNPAKHDHSVHGGIKDKGGRPSIRQPEGKLPGADALSAAMSSGQQMGANALGLEGMGKVPHG